MIGGFIVTEWFNDMNDRAFIQAAHDWETEPDEEYEDEEDEEGEDVGV